ncbi:MAG: CPBP family intramembrane metalloprotease [Anaerolineae bacterium]|nr:CPBP family intramembrane metalloprotease [Anaerolineae bacterium]
MTTPERSIKGQALLLYFILAFAISWGAILIAVGPSGLPVSADQLPVLIVAMLLGPSLAAILAAGLTSGRAGIRNLFSRLRRWRVSARWYAVALLTAPLTTAVVLLILSLFPPEFPTALATSDDKVTLVIMWIASGLLVGFCEELGWTGFAVPRMRMKLGLVATGLLVGLLWGAWHFLVNWEADTFSGALPLALLLARLFSWLPPFRVLMVWVHDRTESLPVVMLMHMSLVANTGIIDPVLAGGRLLIFLLVKAVMLWIIVAVVAMAQRRTGATTP